MKKYISLFICLLLSLAIFAKDPGGLMKDYVDNPEMPGYGLVKALFQEPIKYHVEETHSAKPKKGVAPEYASEAVLTRGINSKAAVVEGFNIWFAHTKDAIEKAGRREEFADIMPYLSRRVLLKEVSNSDEADMSFKFGTYEDMQRICGGSAGGCHWGVQIVVPYIEYTQAGGDDWDSTDATLVHEIGHFYGLGDDYLGTYNKSPEYSTVGRTGKHLTIMDMGHVMGCDDVDSFINAIDYTLAYKKNWKWSERATRGWKSFCDDNMFAEGKELNKPDTVDKQCIYKFNRSGTVSRKLCPEPFVPGGRRINYTKDGTPMSLEDLDMNISILYHTWFGFEDTKPTVTAEIRELGSNKRLMSLKAERYADDTFVSWDFPYQEDYMGVWNDKEGCHLSRLRDLGVLESEYVTLDSSDWSVVQADYEVRLYSDRNYTGENKSLFTEKKIDADIRASEDPKSGWTCSIGLNGTGKGLKYQGDQLVSVDENVVQQVVDRYHVSPAAIWEAGAQSCSRKRFMSSLNFRDLKDLCRFEYRAEDLYKKWRSDNKGR